MSRAEGKNYRRLHNETCAALGRALRDETLGHFDAAEAALANALDHIGDMRRAVRQRKEAHDAALPVIGKATDEVAS